MKRLLLTGFVVLVAFSLAAQVSEGDLCSQAVDSSLWNSTSQTDRGLHFGLETGTAALFSPGSGPASMFYVAPTVSLPVTGRLSLHGGVLASTGFSLYRGSDLSLPVPPTVTSLSFFTAASYRVDERLTVYGSGMKRVLSLDRTGELTAPLSYETYSIGASYRIGRNVTIGATVVISDHNSSYPFASSNPFLYPAW